MAKKKKNYDITHRVMRVRAGDYALLVELSLQAGIPMAEALHLALERQEQEQVTRVSPVQVRMLDIVMPGQVTARIMPRSVTGNGVAHIQPKIIRGVS